MKNFNELKEPQRVINTLTDADNNIKHGFIAKLRGHYTIEDMHELQHKASNKVK